MAFEPGPYVPYPVSEDRSGSPPLGFDPTRPFNPFTGVELIVSGLRRTSLTSAAENLTEIIENLRGDGTIIPNLQIVSPSNVHQLDFVFVSLTGELRENLRPDILENIRVILENINGLEARWKISTGKFDKTRQIYFEASDDVNPIVLKTDIDNMLRTHGHEVQASYIPRDTQRIFYHLVNHESVASLLAVPLVIDGRSYVPHYSRFIQPTFGLEIAINGVGDIPQARSVIDAYLERNYRDDSDEPVVRSSRTELDGSVYCAVLRNPAITSRFLNDPFQIFSESSFSPSPPTYLYVLNSKGRSTTAFDNNRPPPTSIPQAPPSFQQQLVNLIAQNVANSSTLAHVVQEQLHTLQMAFQSTQEAIALAFSHALTAYSLGNRLTASQSELASLQAQLSTTYMLLVVGATPNAQQTAQLGIRIEELNAQINEVHERKARLEHQLDSMIAPSATAAESFSNTSSA
ncbi:hypothetical protein BDZ97DRAFT_1858763 [Flammula alnicola]|nr:hypothetical protein BDZ97DRAFT_1858763 [Flammula alnicola]